MKTDGWASAITRFQQNPSYDAYLELVEVLPFEIMVQYPLMDEAANDFVMTVLPVIDQCLNIEEVGAEHLVNPSVVRICQLSDLPIEQPLLPDGGDRIENSEKFIGLLRGWIYSERHPDRRKYLHKVLLCLIRIYGALALCETDTPSLKKGLETFGEWICGFWLNMLDAQSATIASNMVDILKTIQQAISVSSKPEIIPKAKFFRQSVYDFKNFDENLSRWLKNELNDDEKDIVHEWLLGLTSGLISRVLGEATLLGDVDRDSCRVRAAVALIRLSDMSPALTALSEKENWCLTIVENLYFTEDALLKLASAEVIIEEVLRSQNTCACLFKNNILFKIVEDLNKNNSTPASDISCLRLLANVFEKVPSSRDDLSQSEDFITRVRKILLEQDERVQDQAMAISCVGAIMSDLNPEGLKLIAKVIPEWKSVFEKQLIAGDEHSSTACVMALARMIASNQANSAATKAATQDDPEYQELRAKLLKTMDEEFTPLLIRNTYPKPFPMVRVFIFQFFESLMINHGLFGSVDLYSSTPNLMEQLFDCPSDKLHDVVMARHRYIKKISLLYTFKDKTFEDAVIYCANHGPYDKPPFLAGVPDETLVEDKAAQ